MGQQVAFNTGRHYGKNGQRIAARVLESGRVLFVDIDRGISGITRERHDDMFTLKTFTMMEYDAGSYDDWVPQELCNLKAQLTQDAYNKSLRS